MATDFPTGLDALTNPTATDYLNSPSHAGQHANANDAIEALQAKLGINSSAVTTSHDYKLSLVTGTAKALPDSYLDTDVTLAANSDVKIATQKAVKAYVETNGGADWKPVADSWSYAGADAPTFTITVPSGAAAIYGVGMRIRLTQTTVKYFIITAVADTVLTVYGGTDYTLSGDSITSPYYSSQKAPFGFPLSPAKWTQQLSDTSNATTVTPTQNVWYNVSPLSLSVPIGSWNLSYQANLNVDDTSVNTVNAFATLSTANNSASDDEFTCFIRTEGASGNLTCTAALNRSKNVLLASKTTYYLNHKTAASGIANIGFRGDTHLGNTIIRAVCAYL